MPRFLTRPALALLGTLLCLAAYTPTARPATVGRAHRDARPCPGRLEGAGDDRFQPRLPAGLDARD